MKVRTVMLVVGLAAATGMLHAADWPMWGGTPQRNMVNHVEKNIPASWDTATGKNIKWVARLGSQTYGNPVVAHGKVLVGTNNQSELRPGITGDKGVVLCFRESDGELLWQMTHDKLAAGRVHDWPQQGICSTAAIDGDRFYYVSNRCELVCADLNGFLDGENDGPFTDEKWTTEKDGDIIWKLDMIEELGVFPHNLSTSSPTFDDQRVYVVTSNGVDEAHQVLPAPSAPSFLAIDKKSGKIAWESNAPGEHILHGQWSSPALGTMGGVRQIIFPGGDGRVYSFVPESGKLLWSYQCNPKDSVWKLGGLGTRNNIIATPVIHDDKVFISVGQDPEHGEGPGSLHAINGTLRGDITDKGAVWRKTDVQRSMSTVAIDNGVLYFCDLSGMLRALDPNTGKEFWKHDVFAAVWSSPSVVDGKVFLGDEDGDLVVLAAGHKKQKLFEGNFESCVYTTPVAANGVLFVTSRDHLFALQQGASSDPAKVK